MTPRRHAGTAVGIAVVATLLTILGTVPAGAQQRSTLRSRAPRVGIVDMHQIHAAFAMESREARELQILVSDTNRRLRQQRQELHRLRAERLAAGPGAKAAAMETEIQEKERFLRDLRIWSRQEIERKRRTLLERDPYYALLQRAMEHAAESLGFAVILDVHDESLLWHSRSSDVTDEVLRRMLQWSAAEL